MRITRSPFTAFVVTLVAGALGVPAALAQADEPKERGSFQVWNLNTHKMGEDSSSDYRKFLDYVTDTSNKGVERMPDILTLQEVHHEGSLPCSTFVDELEKRAGAKYKCVETKAKGGNAIVYRTDDNGFKAVGDPRKVGVQIRRDGRCEDSDYKTLVQGLQSKSQDETKVAVAAVHLPVNTNGNDPDCLRQNTKSVGDAVDDEGGDVKVMAGDYNQTGVSPGDGWKSATNDWTKYNSDDKEYKQIDYLFTKAKSVEHAYTVPWKKASEKAPYSDHRGQGAVLEY